MQIPVILSTQFQFNASDVNKPASNVVQTTLNATATAIGTGLANTITIITNQGETATSYAAGLARAHTGGGYMDWYLPSKDELNLLYQNREAVGGFATTGYPTYWSSTQKGITPQVLDKAAGTQADLGIDEPRRVRAIRIF